MRSVIPLFSSPVCTDTYDLNDSEVESIKREKYQPNVAISDEDYRLDGHVSVNKNILENCPMIKDVCLSHTRAYVRDELKISKEYNYKITSSWANLLLPNHSAPLHGHRDAMFTACLYLETPENCGDIVFEQPFTQGWTLGTKSPTVDDYNLFNSGSWSITPNKGMITMFPAHLMHRIEVNKSNQNRYSLAFDVNVYTSL